MHWGMGGTVSRLISPAPARKRTPPMHRVLAGTVEGHVQPTIWTACPSTRSVAFGGGMYNHLEAYVVIFLLLRTERASSLIGRMEFSTI